MQLNLNLSNKANINVDSAVKPHFDPIHVNSSTFLAGLSEKVHRWFRLTPSFAPDLVRYVLAKYSAPKDALIYDPFSGAGTTAIECSLEGYDSLCTEINPFLHFVNQVCLNWDICPSEVESELQHLEYAYNERVKHLNLIDVEANGFEIPPIHNVYRWWRPDVLAKILLIKYITKEIKNSDIKDVFRLALAGILVPDLTNVTLGRLQLHFINRDNDNIDVLGIFSSHLRKIIEDLSQINRLSQRGRSSVMLADAISPGRIGHERSIDFVITSPPYPNRYSYVWNTRPHLYMLDFISEAREASNIDKSTIGGTWGTATSELQKGEFEPINYAVNKIVKPVADQIRKEDNLMANYLVHYFNRLTEHLINIHPNLSKDAKLAYVVGNSWLKGKYVETDVMLGGIFDALDLGYRTTEIQRFRRRHSGKDLYETIVFAENTKSV